MRFPWVSRELYEQSQKRVTDLEAERRLLLNRLAEKGGIRILFPEEGKEPAGTVSELIPVAAASSSETTREPEKLRPTIDDVETWANKWARQRAEERGISVRG